MIYLQAHIDMVKGWVQNIRTANGYLTDAGANVSTERVAGNGVDSTLLVGVFLAELTPLKTTPRRRDWQPGIVIEARVPVKSGTAEAQVIVVLEDLVRCIPTTKPTADDNLATLEIADIAIERQPDGVPYIVVSVTLRATCNEFISQPA